MQTKCYVLIRRHIFYTSCLFVVEPSRGIIVTNRHCSRRFFGANINMQYNSPMNIVLFLTFSSCIYHLTAFRSTLLRENVIETPGSYRSFPIQRPDCVVRRVFMMWSCPANLSFSNNGIESEQLYCLCDAI